jgi:hypothetical protein
MRFVLQSCLITVEYPSAYIDERLRTLYSTKTTISDH